MHFNDRRQDCWIHPHSQGRIIRAILFLQVAAVAAVALVTGLGWFILVEMPEYILFHWSVHVLLFLVCMAGIGAGLYYLSLKVSHRIYGPIHRVMRWMAAVKRGEYPGLIKFREHDYFPELAESVNETLESLYEKEVFDSFRMTGGADPSGNPPAVADGRMTSYLFR